MLDVRVLPHHSLDLVELADSLGIKTELYRYEDAGHVESLWTYTDEFEQIIVRFFQAEDGIRDSSTSRGLGDVYKRQSSTKSKL